MRLQRRQLRARRKKSKASEASFLGIHIAYHFTMCWYLFSWSSELPLIFLFCMWVTSMYCDFSLLLYYGVSARYIPVCVHACVCGGGMCEKLKGLCFKGSWRLARRMSSVSGSHLDEMNTGIELKCQLIMIKQVVYPMSLSFFVKNQGQRNQIISKALSHSDCYWIT